MSLESSVKQVSNAKQNGKALQNKAKLDARQFQAPKHRPNCQAALQNKVSKPSISTKANWMQIVLSKGKLKHCSKSQRQTKTLQLTE